MTRYPDPLDNWSREQVRALLVECAILRHENKALRDARVKAFDEALTELRREKAAKESSNG